VLLTITPQGGGDLRYDTNGDSVFVGRVAPTASVTGAAANDIAPPEITPTHSGPLSQMTITLTATDSGSGVKQLLYSFDGVHFQTYTEPFAVNATQSPLVYAFADDNIANRSSLLTMQLAQRLYVPFTRR
jgi:hypothetical protein